MRGKKHHVSVCVCVQRLLKTEWEWKKKEQTMINQLKIMTNAPD